MTDDRRQMTEDRGQMTEVLDCRFGISDLGLGPAQPRRLRLNGTKAERLRS